MEQKSRAKARGRPFARGGDPRQWRGGRGKMPLTDALRTTLSDDDIEAVIGALLALAKGGNIQAIRELFDRLEGKAVARTEQGEPGDFIRPDLSAFTTEELRTFITRVNRRKPAEEQS